MKETIITLIEHIEITIDEEIAYILGNGCDDYIRNLREIKHELADVRLLTRDIL